MDTPHEKLIEAAQDAIMRVFSDTSVPQSTTRESLLLLIEDIRANIDSLECCADEDDE